MRPHMQRQERTSTTNFSRTCEARTELDWEGIMAATDGFKSTAEGKELEDMVQSMVSTRGEPAVPSSFVAVDDEHVMFLASDNYKQRNLFYCKLDSLKPPAADDAWMPLVSLPTDLSGPQTLTKEETLLRERMRGASSRGVASFHFHAASRRLLVSVPGDNIYWAVLPFSLGSLSGPVPVTPLVRSDESKEPGAKMDPKWSPDGSLVSFVRNSDLWVVMVSTGRAVQVTFSQKEGRTAATADYINQEEFDRYTGYWWAPSSSESASFRILYLEVDESKVPQVAITNAAKSQDVDFHRFPRPGEANCITEVKMVELSVQDGPTDQDRTIQCKHLSLYDSVRAIFPWCEYVVRAAWGLTNQSFFLQLLDRAQGMLAVVEVSVDGHMFEVATQATKPAEGPTVVLEEKTNVWVNVTDVFQPVESGIIWASESSGFRHLELVDSSTQQRTPLTSGSWQVFPSAVHVDSQRKLVFFHANKDSPLEKHFYVVSYENPGVIQRLTHTGFSHSCVMTSNNQLVSTFSSVSSPPSTMVLTVEPAPKDADTLVSVRPIASVPHREFVTPSFSCAPPRLFSFTADRDDLVLYGALFLPPTASDVSIPTTPVRTSSSPPKGKPMPSRYPTLVYVYGGPHVQLVTNDYRVTALNRFQLLARLGFVVAIVDGRGSANRGLAFEGYLKYKMGQVEVADQVCLVDYLTNKLMISDPTRVAITGWSYGGYLTLMAMAQRPDVFKLGIAGAPVTYWEAYDTGYTERYMGTPADNEKGYAMGSVLNYADGFPDEEDRLMIVHGLIDENVHFTHTAALIDAFVALDKPYVAKLFPQERHGIRNGTSMVYFEKIMIRFLRKHLS